MTRTIETSLRHSTRSQRLMAATRAAHDGLDARIVSAEPFRDRESYARLLRMQFLFHRHIDDLYLMPLPLPVALDLHTRRRLDHILRDLADLGKPLPADEARPQAQVDAAAAIGWLWVAEGSSLGAASLLKRAAALGLDATFGARHLAGHPDGRARHWKEFTAAVNGLNLDEQDDARVLEGACGAFAYVRKLADDSFA
jgi:heme oxygenase